MNLKRRHLMTKREPAGHRSWDPEIDFGSAPDAELRREMNDLFDRLRSAAAHEIEPLATQIRKKAAQIRAIRRGNRT